MAGTVTEEAGRSRVTAPLHVGLSLLTLFPGRVGGTETAVRELLAQFAAGNGPERVTVLANRHVAREYEPLARGPVGLHHVSSYRPGDSIPTRALAMAGARLAPSLAARDVPAGLDVMHYAVTVPIPRFRGPTVVTIFDVQHLDLPEFFSRGERAFRRWAYEGAARRATLVVTGSEYSKARLVESAGVEAERVEVVPLGIDRRRFDPAAADGDAELLRGLDLPSRFVIYPANLWPHKNHLRLVEALALAEDRDLALVLTGQDYGRLAALLDHAERLGVRERVRHLGYVARDAVPALYRNALGMVFPSLYEGFGSPPLEAMACGCPVAASGRGSLGEVCGDAALGFAPESPEEIAGAIDRLATDPALRATLRDAGLKRSQSFDWAIAASRHTEIYERATATF
jgi:glycosyltransferase involved in cell wall biosynthesis